jgi:hypothetical protein
MREGRRVHINGGAGAMVGSNHVDERWVAASCVGVVGRDRAVVSSAAEAPARPGTELARGAHA